ncbi:MAG: hypothetical protein QG607_549 [Patescibacteria group bacterium]|nr:hypothetical protein [Patescibacteria group bacterium]
MEPSKYQRKWEELHRALNRLQKFYKNYIHDGEDNLQGPKDFANTFFRISYELKEALKKSDEIPLKFKGYKGDVEQLISSNQWIALSVDIANQEKHIHLNQDRAGKQIGSITSHIYLHSPNGNNRTELKIEINGKKEDCLELSEKVFDAWKAFLIKNKLIN